MPVTSRLLPAKKWLEDVGMPPRPPPRGRGLPRPGGPTRSRATLGRRPGSRRAVLARVLQQVIHELSEQRRMDPHAEVHTVGDRGVQVRGPQVRGPAMEVVGHPVAEVHHLGLGPTPSGWARRSNDSTICRRRAPSLWTRSRNRRYSSGERSRRSATWTWPSRAASGRAKLVRGVAGEPPLPLIGLVEPDECFVQPVEQVVEGAPSSSSSSPVPGAGSRCPRSAAVIAVAALAMRLTGAGRGGRATGPRDRRRQPDAGRQHRQGQAQPAQRRLHGRRHQADDQDQAGYCTS